MAVETFKNGLEMFVLALLTFLILLFSIGVPFAYFKTIKHSSLPADNCEVIEPSSKFIGILSFIIASLFLIFSGILFSELGLMSGSISFLLTVLFSIAGGLVISETTNKVNECRGQ